MRKKSFVRILVKTDKFDKNKGKLNYILASDHKKNVTPFGKVNRIHDWREKRKNLSLFYIYH